MRRRDWVWLGDFVLGAFGLAFAVNLLLFGLCAIMALGAFR